MPELKAEMICRQFLTYLQTQSNRANLLTAIGLMIVNRLERVAYLFVTTVEDISAHKPSHRHEDF
jgi:hypothetical protein